MTAAMQNISHFLGIVNMTERNTIGVMSKANHVYRLLDVFQCLVLFPMFGIRNIYRGHLDNIIATFMEARKDVFYRLMDNPEVDWRRSMWHISLRLWKSIRLRSDHRENDVCVIFDDTDHEKTGRCIERIGRVHSHLAHRAVLGFKCLCMAVTDGVSELLLDLELLGEKGKKGNYGMSEGELSRRHVSTRTSDLLESRKKAYDTSKIALVKEMTRRAVSKGLRFSYALGDSWFTCKEIVRFFADRRRRAHWLGMIKVGEKSRTRYHLGDKALTAPELVNLGKKQGKKKYSRKLGCSYIVHDVMFAGVAVRIFLTKRSKHGKWNGLLSTDTALDFFKAWEIYCRRWSLEVVFKDCKTYLGFGKCQSRCFAAQIAAATICAIQYNLLSIARRFSDYETIGEIFREVSKETVQISVAQQIWGVLQELVNAIADAFGLMDEEIFDVVINQSEKIAHICEFYNLKSAS